MLASSAKDRPVGLLKERADSKALAQKVDRFRLRRWKMLLERELELCVVISLQCIFAALCLRTLSPVVFCDTLRRHSRRHEQAQSISRDEMSLNKLKKTLDDLSSQRDKLQLRLNRNATDGEGEEGEEGADRLQEVRREHLRCQVR
jgi:hypothetical protein